MKKRFRRIELTKEGKMITAGAVAAIVLLALLAFSFVSGRQSVCGGKYQIHR